MEAKYIKYIPLDDIYLFNTGNARKAWVAFGCVYIPEIKMHRFIVWAPNAQSVSLVGDFNEWDHDAEPMEKLESGVWVTFVTGLKDGDLYKYSVVQKNGKRVNKADPFATFSQNRKDTASIVWTDKPFAWSDADYLAHRAERKFLSSPMNIYEVHAGAWNWDEEDGFTGYRYLGDHLPQYLADMHYTHVEFLPLTEYPYDGSWGYQVTGYYAPTSRYGSPEDFKYLIDKLHEKNIGIIMDWVPAHFPKDEHGLANFDGTPLFECKERRMAEHPEWGTLIFDYASDQVRSFLISSACKFCEEYHVDGLRVDAVSSMLYLNYARSEGQYTKNRNGGNINLDAVAFLQQLNSTVLVNYPGAVTIAEEATAYPMITQPPHVGGLGFSFKWDMGFMHDTLDYLKLDPIYRKFHHDKLTFSMMYCFNENYVLAFSHDEVVHGKCSMYNKMAGDYNLKFRSLRAFYGYQFGHPGKKLNFMGGEFAQVIEFDEKRPLDWFLLQYPAHDDMKRYCCELNKLYLANPALYEIDNSWDGFKWLNVNDTDRSSIAFLRTSLDGENMIVCACNFTPVAYENFKIGLPKAGTLKELLNSDDTRFGGFGYVNPAAIRTRKEGFGDYEYSAEFTMPPMASVFFKYKISKTPAKKTENK